MSTFILAVDWLGKGALSALNTINSRWS